MTFSYDRESATTEEAKRFAEDILSAVNESGVFFHSNDPVPVNLISAPKSGVILFVKDPNRPPAAALGLQRCLKAQGVLNVGIDRLSDITDPTAIEFWVSHKPTPDTISNP